MRVINLIAELGSAWLTVRMGVRRQNRTISVTERRWKAGWRKGDELLRSVNGRVILKQM